MDRQLEVRLAELKQAINENDYVLASDIAFWLADDLKYLDEQASLSKEG